MTASGPSACSAVRRAGQLHITSATPPRGRRSIRPVRRRAANRSRVGPQRAGPRRAAGHRTGDTRWRRYFGAQAYREDVLGRPVDLATIGEVREEVRGDVEKDAISV